MCPVPALSEDIQTPFVVNGINSVCIGISGLNNGSKLGNQIIELFKSGDVFKGVFTGRLNKIEFCSTIGKSAENTSGVPVVGSDNQRKHGTKGMFS